MKNKTLFASVRCAIAGLIKGIKDEKNFRYYLIIAILFLALDIWLGADYSEYCVFVILVFAVFALEFVNTAIERLADIVDKKYSKQIEDVKDISAAAVLVCGIAFFITQAIILIPKL